MALWSASLAGLAALGLHVAGFALVATISVPPMKTGVQAKGDGGAAPMTLAAMDAGVAALVAAWDAPPVIAANAPAALPMPGQQPGFSTPLADAQPDLAAAPLPMAPPLQADAAPVVGEAAAPVPSVRPKARLETPARIDRPQPADAPQAARRGATAERPTVAQTAAGAGGGTQAGSGGQAAAGTLSDAAIADQKAAWGAGIRARIERKKRYPAGTTATGTVKLRLTVAADGRLQGMSVVASSGDAALDAAAVKAVQSAGRFSRAPKGLSGTASFTLNITFAG